MSALLENVTKAAQAADLLRQDLRAAHSAAVVSNGAAEILLLDLLETAVEIRNKAERLRSALSMEGEA